MSALPRKARIARVLEDQIVARLIPATGRGRSPARSGALRPRRHGPMLHSINALCMAKMSEPKSQIVVRLPIPLRYAIETRAKAENRTMAGFVRDRLAQLCPQTERTDDAAAVSK
jgi:hypothetical protein